MSTNDKRLVLMFIGILLLMLIVYVCYQQLSCNAITAGMGYPNQWSLFGGCKIEVNNQLIPLENFRFFGE